MCIMNLWKGSFIIYLPLSKKSKNWLEGENHTIETIWLNRDNRLKWIVKAQNKNISGWNRIVINILY